MYKNLCYHTHNSFCDGKNSIEEMIQEAVNQNITSLGISSHAPLKIANKWSISYENLLNYNQEIDNLRHKYRNKLHLFKSLEIDFIPSYTYSFVHFKSLLHLDYTIGSIHLVLNTKNNQLWFIDGDKKECQQNFKTIFNSNIREAITSYYNQMRKMILTQKPDIIGHLDKVVMNTAGEFFNEKESWYQEEVDKTLKVIKEAGSIIEINTRGLYKQKWHTSFPSPEILSKANKLKIPIIITSDAHHTSELLSNYEEAAIIAKECGYSHVMRFENNSFNKMKI